LTSFIALSRRTHPGHAWGAGHAWVATRTGQARLRRRCRLRSAKHGRASIFVLILACNVTTITCQVNYDGDRLTYPNLQGTRAGPTDMIEAPDGSILVATSAGACVWPSAAPCRFVLPFARVENAYDDERNLQGFTVDRSECCASHYPRLHTKRPYPFAATCCPVQSWEHPYSEEHTRVYSGLMRATRHHSG